jgi:hypothetical protein
VRLVDLIPDAEVLCALEPEELGLRMLSVLAKWPERQPLTLDDFVVVTVGDSRSRDHTGQYPRERTAVVDLAIREAWAWLEGLALLIKHPGYQEPNRVRWLSR